MTDLTKGGQGFKWTPEAQSSFAKLKEAFCHAPLLVQFQLDKEIFLETDVSNYALSGILSQKDLAGHKHPVAFYS